MRVLLAGGGTGGHLFPAVALGQLLLKEVVGAQILFVGTKRGIEYRLLPQLQLPLALVDMVGVVGRGWRGKLELVPKLTRSLIQAQGILRKFQPDLVVGFGGYASVPVLLAAKFLHIPYLIHEQNAIPGVSNKFLAKGAARICVSYPDTLTCFPRSKATLTGNPLRQGFDQIPETLPVPGQVLVFGGSRGARAINEALVACLPELLRWAGPPQILHQTGEDDFDMVQAAYAAAGYPAATIVPFIDDMAGAYSGSALVICRAGATTLAELTVCGRPAILIPFPHATGDHQNANARALEQAGAAVVLQQRDLTALRLATELRILLADREELQLMAMRARSLARPDAARKILVECRNLVPFSSPAEVV
ncbi:MAG TPA: undecaprenyldiphospho-muramoylpentapeptide beta-N-acetylglucosaminyltransferase [Pelovirga sp.]|nr:undecaprenyldiphospho-muramoylpentapeptide beta-N-acetylglucosaminyltransferase [Pelovirga sp.]